MAWQRWLDRGKHFSTFISIWRNGKLAISAGAVRRFGVNRYKYAVLFYDPVRERIGIRLTNDSTERGTLKIVSHHQAGSVSAKPFLDCHGLNEYCGRRYPVKKDPEDDLLIAELRREPAAGPKGEGRRSKGEVCASPAARREKVGNSRPGRRGSSHFKRQP
jgi:hypothetical protein